MSVEIIEQAEPTDEIKYVDWAAIFGSVAISAATTLLLSAVGVALGLASVSPWTSNPSATTLGLAGYVR